MKKKIERLNHQGEGITYVNDKITFVKNALVDEEVELINIKEYKKYNVADAKIVNFSNKRVDPVCPYFGLCGGCSLQNMSYKDSLEFKVNKVKNILNRYADLKIKDIDIIPSDNSFNYRNKITLEIKKKLIGFKKYKSNELVEIDKCYLAKESINNIIEDLKKLDIINGKVTIRSNYNDELILIIETLDNINITALDNHKILGIILNDKIIQGENKFMERINNKFYQVSYNSFFQVNNDTTSKIMKYINNLINNEIVLDLYCGVGSLGLSLDNYKELYGVEIVPNAIKNALVNKKINHKENAYFFVGDTSNVLTKINKCFDAIIVDPPRSGMNKETLELILNINPEKIIYVSCDPITLARDLNLMSNKYELKSITLFDTFCYTYHVECVTLLHRNN